MIQVFTRPCARLAKNVNTFRTNSTRSSGKASSPLPYSQRQPPSSKPSPAQPAAAPEPKRASGLQDISPWRLSLWTLNTFIVGHLVFSYLFVIKTPIGPSMLPTLDYSHEYLFISILHARMTWIKVGDLISFHNPSRRDMYSIKRVIGMPGDFVLRDTPGKGDGTMVRVPKGHCWVVGDNLDGSRDSRMFGAVPLALIRGKVMARVWPNPTLFNKAFTDRVVLEDD